MIYTVTFNPAIDYVVRLDTPLEVGEVNRAKGEDCVLGGKGINVSGVLAELGCRNTALGFVAGETGAWLERGLAAQGITTDFIHLEQGMTRINVKIKAGQETELNGAGPDIPESAMEQLEAQLDKLAEGDILVEATEYAETGGGSGSDPIPAAPRYTPNMVVGAAKEFTGKGLPTIDAAYEAVVLYPSLNFPLLEDWLINPGKVCLKANPNILFIKQ